MRYRYKVILKVKDLGTIEGIFDTDHNSDFCDDLALSLSEDMEIKIEGTDISIDKIDLIHDRGPAKRIPGELSNYSIKPE